MGNNHPRYYNPKEAAGVLGLNTWDRLMRQLNLFCGKYVEYGNFVKIVSVQFDRMVINHNTTRIILIDLCDYFIAKGSL